MLLLRTFTCCVPSSFAVILYKRGCMLIGQVAPNFKAKAVFNSSIVDLELSHYSNKYVVLFFYPADFTFVCPTELHSFQERFAEFQAKEVELLACSVDSVFSHLAWLNTSKSVGGIEGVAYPLISDLGGEIARDYGVLSPENQAYRALFLLDKAHVIRAFLVNDMPLGRNVDEVLRLVDALQHVEDFGEVCPVNWSKGQEAMLPTLDSVKNYFKK